jgi:hypothetical protein
LTAFTLVMVASVVYAYRAVAAPRSEQPEVAVRSQVALKSPASEGATTSASTFSQQVSPRDAASLAAAFLQQSEAYSVELSQWNGVSAYKVTFSSGDVAYISLDGQLLGSVPFNSYVSYSGGGGGGGGGSQTHVVQYDDDDHEDEEDEHEQEHEEEHEEQHEVEQEDPEG